MKIDDFSIAVNAETEEFIKELKWDPKEIYAYKSDTIEREMYATEFATERAEGKAEEKEITAKKMLNRGFSVEDVCDITGFDVEFAKELTAKIQ